MSHPSRRLHPILALLFVAFGLGLIFLALSVPVQTTSALLGDSVALAVGTPTATRTPTVTVGPYDSIKISFQPANAFPVAGYMTDAGRWYGPRGNGLYSFGWNRNQEPTAQDCGLLSDQRYDTLVLLEESSFWQIAVPNGTYDLFMVVGASPSCSDPASYSLKVNGTHFLDGTATQGQPFIETQTQVTVVDGKIKLERDGGSVPVPFAFLHLTRLNTSQPAFTTTPTQTPTRTPTRTPTVPPDYYSRIQINFQPMWAATPVDYTVDAGSFYAPRGNGTYSFGWLNTQPSMWKFNRSTDQRYDTTARFGLNSTWQIALPNGTYDLFAAAGDILTSNTQRCGVRANGTTFIDGTINTQQFWLTGTTRLIVTDGFIKVDYLPDHYCPDLFFLHITRANNTTPTSTTFLPTRTLTPSISATPTRTGTLTTIPTVTPTRTRTPTATTTS